MLYHLSYHKVQRISGGVTGTPTYFLNDVPIAAEQTWTLTDWKQVIDPLLVGVRSLKAVSISLLVPEVTEICSCSTQLSIKFILLINVKMPTFVDY